MPRGRPRTQTDPAQTRGRTLGDAELTSDAPKFPSPRREWDASTTAAYRLYEKSTAARALRAEDMPDVTRRYDYVNDLVRFRAALSRCDPVDAHPLLMSVAKLESMIQTLDAKLGIGPRGRQSLGIVTENKVGSRLERFNQGETT